jgi:ferrous iron transport protein B
MLTAERLPRTSSEPWLPQVVVVGKESVGKSQLLTSLTGRFAGEANFRGSTVAVDYYRTPSAVFVDTPGILRRSDTATTRLALDAVAANDLVLLVVQAVNIDEDLTDMLPLVQGKRGIVVVTYWDKVEPGQKATDGLERLEAEVGPALIPVDARNLKSTDRVHIQRALDAPRLFTRSSLLQGGGWRIEPKAGLFEHKLLGPLLSVCLLVLPALAAVFGANAIAGWLDPVASSLLEPAVAHINVHWPSWTQVLFTAEQGGFRYGLLNMGPFLFVWALPTVLLFAVILAIYKSSGLIDRINCALHPLVRPFGLSGRDVVRVVMGFGCNVPAVISTRACSECSRNSAMAAISFGAMCSYQLPATLAVLSAAGKSTGQSEAGLTIGFLGYLFITTLIYLRLTANAESRSSLNLLMIPKRPFMQWPRPQIVAREACRTVRQFLLQAVPTFVVLCVIASLLVQLGVIEAASSILDPLMQLFDLPPDVALPIALAGVRKDGIFMLVANDRLATPLSAAQALTSVYLAGVLVPCLVTVLAIARETSWVNAGKLLMRQAAFAAGFALILAWGGRWIL